MTSVFQIDTTLVGLTALDELATPLPDPQWEFHEYRKVTKLGDGTLKGRGPSVVVWTFPMIEDEQIAQLEEFISADAIYITSRKRDGTLADFEVLMNWPDPRLDGDHMPGFQGLRSGLTLEFIVLSEV